MSGKLHNKVAIVTGASNGIGAGIAKALATAGASVVINYNSNKAGGEAVVSSITLAGGNATAVGADISTKAGADHLIDAAIKHYGQLDIVVNNAGVAEAVPFEDFSEEAYRRLFDTNVLGTMLVTAAALKHLKTGASIINIGSVATHFAPSGMAVYTATKGAIDGFTSVLANELGPRGIRVNALKPGMTATERVVAAGVPDSDFAKTFLARTPLGRFGTTMEMGKAAVFLASDDSSFITGDHLLVAGGLR